ncbi:hypothetical protein ACA910_000502 [Epithemia clementina (nom. ined.)]
MSSLTPKTNTPQHVSSSSTFASYASSTAIADEQTVTTLGSASTSTIASSSLVRQLPPLAAGHRRIVLLRHGETEWNRRGMIQGGGYDLELNESGRQQAQAAQNQLRGLPLGVIASSHLERSAQTADIIAQAFPKAVRVVQPKFGEMRFGSFEGLKIRRVAGDDDDKEEEDSKVLELRERYHEINRKIRDHDNVAWPGGGESRAEVVERGRAALQHILKSYPEVDHICIVAHGRFNRLLLTALLGFSNPDAIVQGNTCINVLDVNEEDDQWKALVLNHLDHITSQYAKQAPS